MNQWDLVRTLARKKRIEIDTLTQDESATALIAAISSSCPIQCEGLSKDEPLLYGAEAALDVTTQRIWFNKELDLLQFAEYIVHEYAHYWLEGGSESCTHPDLESRLTEEKSPLDIDRVENYSPKERREGLANVFAREFLLPADRLKTWFIHEHWSASKIAQHVGVSENLVFTQLTDVLLLPSTHDESLEPSEDTQGRPQTPGMGLDPSQSEAAHAPQGPLLVEAGPGTGKTRTLVGRIEYLVTDQKIDPQSILVLTFSNKAADEMRKRLAKVLPNETPQIWMGTFHAFGLDVLRKYGYALGLPASPKLLGPVSALLLMEQLLPRMELNHYQNLFDPALPLQKILQAISRAKDELVGPEKYREMAEEMARVATEEDKQERSEKVLEVAGIYALYQSHLEQEQLLDFGDLIAKTVQLMTGDTSIRQAIRDTYRHILVDEYQDVNRACALLLQQLAGDGKGLWVVGDARQSIYRFRGAAPYNMSSFVNDFPEARSVSLRRNYRSQPALVKTFSDLARQMDVPTTLPFEEWETSRSDVGGAVLMEHAEDPEAEGEAMAREIQHRYQQGMAYRDQAVLCRSHTNLAKIAALLEKNGIPTLYIGNLFERPEILDLLSLVSLVTGDARGLLRVATFPEYQLTTSDLQLLFSLAKKAQVPFPDAIGRFKNEQQLSTSGRTALELLDKHLQDIQYRGTWSFLAHYLFNRSSYLISLLNSACLAAHQQLIAIYQFIRFAYEQDRVPADGVDVKRRLLAYVRRLEIYGEEKQLRQIPEAGQAMDAVRLLTIHASKGLEFRAVYLPLLGKGIVPAGMKAQQCFNPDGMVLQDPKDAHIEEEICLFFVALSRARDFLCLSRPTHRNGRNSNPSDYLALIASAVSAAQPFNKTATLMATEEKVEVSEFIATDARHNFEVDELDLYLRCPRRYYYENVLGFSRNIEDSAFLRFDRCLKQLIAWIEEKHTQTGSVEVSEVLQEVENIWATTDLIDHPFGSIYRKNTEVMIVRALQVFSNGREITKNKTIQIDLDNGVMLFSPDHIEINEAGQHIFRRMRTGRLKSKEADNPVYGLYHQAARQLVGKSYEVEVVSLTSDKVEPIPLTSKKVESHLATYHDAIQGILTGQFPAEPAADWDCPRCPNFFICPALPKNLSTPA